MGEGYRIKQVPEDFLVREVMDIEGRMSPPGRFSYYLLRKRDYTTQRAAELAARALGKRMKYVNFSGNKDRHAVTEQFLSMLHGPGRGLELEGVSLEFLGRGRERINLGDSEGNEFEIVVRNLGRGFRIMGRGQDSRHPEGFISGIPNYFGGQRFGANLNNHVVGRHIVRREFREAAGMVPECREWLSGHPNDFVGALRSLPKRVLRLYPHSYQSFLWNETAGEYLKGFRHREIPSGMGKLVFSLEEVSDGRVPLVGYRTRIPGGETGRIIRRLLEREGVSPADFRMSQFPEFDLKGGQRELFINIRDLEISGPERDELNPGRKKVLVRFFLPKGSYATVVIRAMFG